MEGMPRIFIAMFVAVGSFAAAQVQTSVGTPPFASVDGSIDTINLGNLNIHIAVPIFSRPGRGLNFSDTLTYDSSLYVPLYFRDLGPFYPSLWNPQFSQLAWQEHMISGPDRSGSGYLWYSKSQSSQQCNLGGYYGAVVSGWVYYDATNTSHQFQSGSIDECDASDSFRVVANDGSGFTLAVSYTQAHLYSIHVISRSGTDMRFDLPTSADPAGYLYTNPLPVYTITDTNGNYISAPIPLPNGFYTETQWTDTLGTQPYSQCSPGTNCYAWLSPEGIITFPTENSSQYSIATAFNCPQNPDIPGSGYTVSQDLLSSFLLPDGTGYQFGYEATPGHAGSVTGRIASITLPTGGVISYSYTGPNDGINCSDGSTMELVRTAPDGGVTTYTRTGSGTSWTTKVVDPQGNLTVIDFQAEGPNLYETKRQIYAGSSSLLRTIDTCYNGASPDCTATPITLPITQRSVYTTLETGARFEVATAFDPTYALPVETDEYDYGATSPTRKTIVTYAFQQGVNVAPDRIASIQVLQSTNGSYTQAAYTQYSYDEYSSPPVHPPLAVSSSPQHNTPAGGRGNLTTISQWVNTGGTLNRTFTYDDTGNVTSTTDAGSHTTSFQYSTANAYLSLITLPQTGSVSHGISPTYESNMGMLKQIVDQNQQTTKFSYSYASGLYHNNTELHEIDYPDGGKTVVAPQTVAGPSNSQGWPTFFTRTGTETQQYTSVSSYVDSILSLDSSGRPQQEKLIDSAGNDLTDYSYDSLGRLSTVSNPYRSKSDVTYGVTCNGTWNGTACIGGYDAIGRPTTITETDGSTVTAQYRGNCVMLTDETQRQKNICTDSFGRVTEVDEPRVVGDPVMNYDVMQTDGNLVVYAQGGVPEWSSGTWQTSSGGSYVLDMQNDGNLVLYKTYSLWGSSTVQSAQGAPYATPGCTNIGSALSQGQSLAAGSCLVSTAGRYELVMQGDGNLVLYDLSRSPILALWSSTTAGTGASYAIMQTDGNFVLYKQGGIPVPWSTNTWQSSPQGSFFIVMQDDGNLVVYNTYSLWASNTVQSGGSAGPYPTPSCSNIGWQLAEGQTLSMNSCLVSTSGRYELVLQSDGNLVLYDLSSGSPVPLWNSGTEEFTPFTYPYTTRYFYDALDNLTCIEQHGDEGGPGCSSPPSQDASSGWRVRRFTYDSLSRLLSSSTPESGTASYSYAADANCNPGGEELLSVTDARGIATNYCYDALHRLTAVTYSDATPAISIAYDASPWGFPVKNAIGRMTQSMSPSVAQILSYDSMGRVATQWNCVPSNCNSTIGTYATSALYDLAGNVTQLTYPDGRVANYQFDGTERLYNVSSSGNSVLNVSSFWPAGQWRNAALGNGATTSDTYNSRLQPFEFQLTGPSGGKIADLSYSWSECDGSYGDNGNLCSIYDSVTSGHSATFTHDLLNRISSASETDGAFNQVFSYDPWGNMSYSGGAPNPTNYSLLNRNAAYCNDAAGNILDYGACPSSGPHQFAWDAAGQLSSISGQNPATYTYDAEGNRVRKDVSSTWTEYIYFNGQPIAENSPTGWSDYVFAGSNRIAQFTGSAVQYYWTDHLGSTRVTMDGSGNPQCNAVYTPFGSELASCPTHYDFAFSEHDAESNLEHMTYRQLSNTQGRWLSPDPDLGSMDLTDPQSFNRYAYVENNPLSAVDPDGLDGCSPMSGGFDCSVSTGAGSSGGGGLDFGGPFAAGPGVGMGPGPGLMNLGLPPGIAASLEFTPSFSYGTPTMSPTTTLVGSPPFGWSLVPIVGSGWSAVNDFQTGHWGWGLVNTGMAVSDVFLVKSLATSAGKVGVGGLVKFGGSHTWGATRSWMVRRGWEEGIAWHHWLVPQGTWGRMVPDIVKNQPWNVMPISSRTFHMAIHGVGPRSASMGTLGRLWFGSPTWAKVAAVDAVGKWMNACWEWGC